MATTYNSHALPVAPNLLVRNFNLDTPNNVSTGDMTYIATCEGWPYLAVVLELFSCCIVGWTIGPAITAALPCHALDMVWHGRKPTQPDLPHRSRRQYASHRDTEVLAEHGIKASMSRKDNCWDNACSEMLFGSLKVERLRGMELHNQREAKHATVDWLRRYNLSRMYFTLVYLSPERRVLRARTTIRLRIAVLYRYQVESSSKAP